MKLSPVTEWLIWVLIILVVVLLSPIWIPVFGLVYVSDKVGAWRFRKFLRTHEGSQYFAYTNRQRSVEYVRTNILPFLPPNTEILYLTDKFTNLGDETKYLGSIVGEMRKTEGGFPYVSKVVGGQLVTRSINNELYRSITRKVAADNIIKRIDKFLST
jgi:hypothetical protein